MSMYDFDICAINETGLNGDEYVEVSNLYQETIYATVIVLLVSNRDLNLPEVLLTELAVYPPSMFHPDGNMRLATGKSMLKKNLAVEVPLRTSGSPTDVIIDVSTAHRMVDWHIKGPVQTFIPSLKVWCLPSCLSVISTWHSTDTWTTQPREALGQFETLRLQGSIDST